MSLWDKARYLECWEFILVILNQLCLTLFLLEHRAIITLIWPYMFEDRSLDTWPQILKKTLYQFFYEMLLHTRILTWLLRNLFWGNTGRCSQLLIFQNIINMTSKSLCLLTCDVCNGIQRKFLILSVKLLGKLSSLAMYLNFLTFKTRFV